MATDKNEKQLWKYEFGALYDPPQEIKDLIESGTNIFDESWHNDVLPHLAFYLKPEDRGMIDSPVELWFDAIEPENREFSEMPRYGVAIHPNTEQEEYFQTNDVALAIAKFNQAVSEVISNG